MTQTRGYLYGFIAMFGFGATFIAIALAKESFDPTIVGVGRIVPAGIGAIIGLKLTGQKLLPPREVRKWVAVIAAGIIIGFPIFSTLAMQTIPAGDAGLIVAVAPVLTAATALFYGHGRPRSTFWIAASIGTLGAIGFAITRSSDGVFSSGGSIWGYASMALAMFLSSNANIAGATLVKRGYNAFYVIMWAIVMSIPVLLPITIFDLVAHPIVAMPSLSAMLGFLWVSLFSIFIGQYFWNSALAAIGVVKASQLQLIQPIFTMIFALLILGEPISPLTGIAAVVIIGSVAVSQRLK
jgi:drug/metabolite transporter (DMT)-like permease